MIAEMPAVISPGDDDGVGGDGGVGVQGSEYAAELVIRETRGGEVAVDESAG